MATVTVKTNAPFVAAQFKELGEAIRSQQTVVFKQIGPKIVADVQTRIKTQDNGSWAHMSKWVAAKKNPQRVLEGAERFVKYRIVGGELQVYGETDGEWTLTQHHEGFENKEDHKEDDRIVIDIVNPGPLGLTTVPNGKFSWVPKDAAHRTPARKIWPSEAEVDKITLPIASRWLQKLVTDILKGSVLQTDM